MKQQERGISMAVREKKVRKYKDSDEKITARSLITPFVFSLPFMIGLLIFTVYPFIRAVLLSFMEDYRFLSGKFSGYGLGNYTAIFSDPNFINALKSTTKYVLIVVPTSLVISILVAVGLNNVKKLQGLFQTAYFLPMVTSSLAVGLAWRFMFNDKIGILNYLLGLMGLEPVNWLGQSSGNFMAVVVFGIWSIAV